MKLGWLLENNGELRTHTLAQYTLHLILRYGVSMLVIATPLSNVGHKESKTRMCIRRLADIRAFSILYPRQSTDRNRNRDVEDPETCEKILHPGHTLPPFHRRIDHGKEVIIEPFYKNVDCSASFKYSLGLLLDSVGTADDEYDTIQVCVKVLKENTVWTRLQ